MVQDQDTNSSGDCTSEEQDTGIDSIQIISLAMFIRKRFSVKVPARKLLDPTMTIRDLANFVNAHTGQLFEGHLAHSNGVSSKTFDLVRGFERLCKELTMSLYQSVATYILQLSDILQEAQTYEAVKVPYDLLIFFVVFSNGR